MSPLEIGGVVGGLVGISGALGAAYAVLRSQVVQTTLSLQRTEIDALKSRVDTLTTERAALAERVAALESANRVLGEIVAGIRPKNRKSR